MKKLVELESVVLYICCRVSYFKWDSSFFLFTGVQLPEKISTGPLGFQFAFKLEITCS